MPGWAIALGTTILFPPRFSRAGGVEVAEWPALDGTGLRAVVTTRHGGVSTGPYRSLNLGFHVGDRESAVVENRRRAAAALGVRAERLVSAHQVHGRGVLVVDGAARPAAEERPPEADALVTTDPGVTLLILVADCVPVVLWDPDGGVLGCAHAGWRGTSAGVVGAAVATMVGLGADPASIRAGIGPAVAADSYQVGPEVAAALRASVAPGHADPLVRQRGDGTWVADLAGLNQRALLDAGLLEHHVHRMEAVTGADGPFFSDRAARPCGRFGLLARILA